MPSSQKPIEHFVRRKGHSCLYLCNIIHAASAMYFDLYIIEPHSGSLLTLIKYIFLSYSHLYLCPHHTTYIHGIIHDKMLKVLLYHGFGDMYITFILEGWKHNARNSSVYAHVSYGWHSLYLKSSHKSTHCRELLRIRLWIVE